VQSGHGSMVRPMGVAERLTIKLAKLLKVTPDLAGFRSKTIAEGLEAVATVSTPGSKLDLRDHNGIEPTYGLSKFLPWYGDEVLPDAPLEALSRGVGGEIDLLIGANREEMNVYFVPTGVRAKLNGLLAWLVLRRVQPKARQVLSAYAGKGKTPGHVFTEALTDLVFRMPAHRFAEAHLGRTHVYEFAWRSPACGGELGACHALELPFVFKTLAAASGEKGFCGPNPPQALADRIHDLWVGFARDGSLPWGEYSAQHRQVHQLDTGKTVVEPVAAAARFVP
jgi:para-nitrobenzyl esterase